MTRPDWADAKAIRHAPTPASILAAADSPSGAEALSGVLRAELAEALREAYARGAAEEREAAARAAREGR